MTTDANRYFLKLAETNCPVSQYESDQGCAYLVGGLDTVKTVLDHGSAFGCPSHQFRSTYSLLSPLGLEWLGMDSDTAHSRCFIHRVQDFFSSYTGLYICERSTATGALSSKDFYFELKAMFFALSTYLLFEYDLGTEATNVAQASNVIEDLRARFGVRPLPERHKALRLRAHLANSVFQQLSESIQRHRGQEPTSDLTYAIQETVLNAAVPLAYAFIWTLLLLGRNECTQTLVWRDGQKVNASGMLSRNNFLKGPCCSVVKEALRLYPPVWAIGLTCARTQFLAGNTIKPGDPVVISPYALHRMQALWHRPGRFSPERFEGGASKGYAFIPFGAGSKTCPAARWNVPILVVAVQSFLESYFIRTTKWPRALPLVALRPSMGFAVSLQLRD